MRAIIYKINLTNFKEMARPIGGNRVGSTHIGPI